MAVKTADVTKDARVASASGFDAGAGASDFLPWGLYSGYLYRTLLGFGITSSWFSGMYQVTAAKLWVRTSTQSYVAFGGSPLAWINRLTADFTEGSANSLSSGNAVVYSNQPAHTTTNRASKSFPTTESTWVSIDVLAMVEDILPPSVKDHNGVAGGGSGRLYGFKIIAQNETTSGDVMEIYSDDTSSNAYLEVTYSSNATPTTPGWVSPTPANLALVNGNPTLAATTTDSNDTVVTWDIQVDDNSDFSSPLVNLTGQAQTGTLAISYATSGLPGGVALYARVRAKDPTGALSAWSSTRTFTINRPPTVSGRLPGAAGFATIWNLDENAIWTLGGSHAKGRFFWTYSDPDGHGQSAFQLRIYSASVAGTTLYDSGKVASSNAFGDANFAMVLGTEYWWTVDVWDSNDLNMGESARTAFKTRWGQAIYEYNPGAGSSSWGVATGTIAGGQVQTLYRSATGAGGTGTVSAWMTNIGAVTPAAYVQILVRMVPTTPGTNVTMSDLTFSYLGSASQPDRWSFSPATEWQLDPATRRFGSQALKCTIVAATTGNRTAYPFRKTLGDDLPVVSGTVRTLSAYVKTNGILSGGSVSLVVNRGGGGALIAQSAGVTNTSASPDGWQRMTLTYTVPAGVTTIRPIVQYTRTVGVAESFWLDALMDEEGTVASQWQPGFVGDPVVLDSNGIMVDGNAGGIARFRGLSGGSRDQVELGLHGWLFTDVELWSPAAETLRIGDGLGQQTLEIDGPASGAVGGKLALLGAGANADAAITNDSGNLVLTGTKAPVVWVYTAGGVWNRPSAFAYITVEVVGGGGGGGGCGATSTGQAASAGHGGGGGYAKKLFTAAQLASLTGAQATVTVGAGGAGAVAGGNNGTVGNPSSFAGTGITTVQGNGGGAGSAATAAINGSAGGGAGGTSSGGDTNVPGGDGGNGFWVSGFPASSGVSGGTPLGTPVAMSGSIVAGAAGATGHLYGAGGTGASRGASQAAAAGGTGGAGVVIVTEYYV